MPYNRRRYTSNSSVIDTETIYDVAQQKLQSEINAAQAEINAADHVKDFSDTATDIKVNGTQSAGTSTKAARADHVHPITPIGATGLGYGICSTAESTTAKEASIDDFILKTGAMPSVKFTYAVPANSKLNINGTGSKSIYISYGGMLTAIPAGLIKAGDTVTFVYNGSQYIVQSIFSQVRAVNKFGNITSLSIEEVSS